ncbi:MAG: type II secretion system protein [Planctomycetota bacterium]
MRLPITAHPDPKRAGGFTLVELTLTLIIIGAVAAIGVPRYANALTRYKADAAARRVVADIARAQTHARANSTTATLRFRVGLDLVTISELPHLDLPSQAYTTQLAEEPYDSNLTAADFGGDTYLVFDGYGQPDSGGTLTIRCGSNLRTITVDPDTGEASIQ